MKRELKFRVWDIDCNRWMERKWDRDRKPVWHHGDEHSPYVSLDWILKNERYWAVQENTGLKDKNGKEIYEGDILSHGPTYKPYVVEYDDRIGAFTASGFPFNLNEGRYVSTRSLEVIGNIFENKDLLKKK